MPRGYEGALQKVNMANERSPGRSRVGPWLSRLRALGPAGWPVLLASVIGLALRLEFAATFNGKLRGADYERHFSGVYWMMHHWRAFNFDPEVNWTISNYPPGWYMTGAVVYLIFHAERAVAFVSVAGWAVRQFLLSRILVQAIPQRRWAIFVALTVSAFLPISVETDGTTNPEALHTSLFAIAVYWLWRMEREARDPAGIRRGTACLFGFCAGLGMLTKATSGVLPIALLVMIVWQMRNARRAGDPWSDTWRRFLQPAVFAGCTWILVTGWWIGPNLLKYHHPFPHPWDLSPPPDIPDMALPALYRRPLGWALPFSWKHWLAEPIQQNYLFPIPNLWAQFVVGTWSDLINRGFCRVPGDGVFTKYFDGWPVSGRCVQVMSIVARMGLLTTVFAVSGVFRTLANYLRNAGHKGSLTLPLIAMLVVFFTGMFTLTYPVDGMVSTNARYLLPASLPIAACLAIGLSEVERPWLRRTLTSIMSVVVALAALLVIYERFGT